MICNYTFTMPSLTNDVCGSCTDWDGNHTLTYISENYWTTPANDSTNCNKASGDPLYELEKIGVEYVLTANGLGYTWVIPSGSWGDSTATLSGGTAASGDDVVGTMTIYEDGGYIYSDLHLTGVGYFTDYIGSGSSVDCLTHYGTFGTDGQDGTNCEITGGTTVIAHASPYTPACAECQAGTIAYEYIDVTFSGFTSDGCDSCEWMNDTFRFNHYTEGQYYCYGGYQPCFNNGDRLNMWVQFESHNSKTWIVASIDGVGSWEAEVGAYPADCSVIPSGTVPMKSQFGPDGICNYWDGGFLTFATFAAGPEFAAAPPAPSPSDNTCGWCDDPVNVPNMDICIYNVKENACTECWELNQFRTIWEYQGNCTWSYNYGPLNCGPQPCSSVPTDIVLTEACDFTCDPSVQVGDPIIANERLLTFTFIRGRLPAPEDVLIGSKSGAVGEVVEVFEDSEGNNIIRFKDIEGNFQANESIQKLNEITIIEVTETITNKKGKTRVKTTTSTVKDVIRIRATGDCEGIIYTDDPVTDIDPEDPIIIIDDGTSDSTSDDTTSEVGVVEIAVDATDVVECEVTPNPTCCMNYFYRDTLQRNKIGMLKNGAYVARSTVCELIANGRFAENCDENTPLRKAVLQNGRVTTVICRHLKG